jgi:hypothetical protein
MDQSMEKWFGFQDVFALIPRHLNPAIHKIYEKTSVSRGFASMQRLGNEGVILAMGGVDKEVKAAVNGKPKLVLQ